MNKIERLKNELSRGIVIQVIFAGITSTAIYCLAMAWINHNFISFIIAGLFTICGGWFTFMQSLSILHTWQKVGREQLRMDLEDAKRRFDIRF